MSYLNSERIRDQHKWYNMTHSTNDSAELARRLNEAHQDIMRVFEERRELQVMEKRIEERIMKNFSVKVLDEASPAIQKLNSEIKNLLK